MGNWTELNRTTEQTPLEAIFEIRSKYATEVNTSKSTIITLSTSFCDKWEIHAAC